LVVHFQYDSSKAKSNLKKHGVSFADAEGVFYDLWLCIAQIPTLKEKNASLQWALGALGRFL
jgi:uncharacterized DUF497 family protein